MPFNESGGSNEEISDDEHIARLSRNPDYEEPAENDPRMKTTMDMILSPLPAKSMHIPDGTLVCHKALGDIVLRPPRRGRSHHGR